MSTKKIHTDFFDGSELPITVPSADMAWADMSKKLDKDKGNKKPFFFWLAFSMVLIMVAGLFVATVMTRDDKTEVTVVENSNDDNAGKNDDFKKSPAGETSKQIINNISDSISKRSKKMNFLNSRKNKISSVTASKKYHTAHQKNKGNFSLQSVTGNNIKSNSTAINESAIFTKTNTNEEQPLITKDSIAKKLSADSSSAAMDNAKDSAAKIQILIKPKTTVLAGLQWNAQIPFAGVNSYFSGPGAQLQPYRILLPGVWVSVMEGNSVFTMEANLFYTASVPSKLFFTGDSHKVNGDTAIITTETKTLTKLFGFSAGVGYNQHIKNNWWVGGSMQFVSWNKGIVHSSGTIEKKSLSGTFETITGTFNNHHPITAKEKTSFSKSQFILNAEAWYREDMWQAGLRTGIAVTPLANQKGPSNSFRTDIMFRIALWNSLKND